MKNEKPNTDPGFAQTFALISLAAFALPISMMVNDSKTIVRSFIYAH